MHASRTGKHSLADIARRAMLAHGLEPDFSSAVQRELEQITGRAHSDDPDIPDVTERLWCSIDNDDSMDLDQITVAEAHADGSATICVGVADVDALVRIGQPIDQHAQHNTTSIYTGVRLFPMLPEKLSTDLTSLSPGEVRLALVMEMRITADGQLADSTVYRARVRNQAKLTYNSVSAWLDGKGPLPDAANRIAGLDSQLRLQDRVAQTMRSVRHQHGALELETIEPRSVMLGDAVIDLAYQPKTRAGELIEDCMIAANGVAARYLASRGYPTLLRVVRRPKRWERIVQVALDLGETLPADPDATALGEFLSRRRVADPLRFPDLSLTIVKLLGRGEYVLQMPGVTPIGHFGLAVRDYTHSTAPNRRFPDLITHRLLKAALAGTPAPYDEDTLRALATHCTEQENASDKVERHVRKSASALFMASRIGDHFDAIVTGASEKGTWARVVQPPVEGRIVHGANGLDVGDTVRVTLVHTDVERGFIDFARA